jgi:dTDP-4-dehydrorhamnose reductase
MDYPQVDLGDQANISNVIDTIKPDYVINAAAYTAVDKAETEPETAKRINAYGVEILAKAIAAINGSLVHVSTDFVFDGDHGCPYEPEDACTPLGIYGLTKFQGETAVRNILPDRALIIRTAWLYSSHGANFVKTMLRLMGERESLNVVDDQIGTPTWAHGLAITIWQGISKNLTGLYHWTDAGVASWYDFALAIRDEALACGLLEEAIPPVNPISAAAYPTPAKRPPFSVLDKRSTWQDFAIRPVHWREQLRSMLKELRAHA